MNYRIGLSLATVLLLISVVRLLLILISVGSASSSVSKNIENPNLTSPTRDQPNYRLSHDVIPSNYNLTITPDLKKWTFFAVVKITVRATAENIKNISLHAKDLTLENNNVQVYPVKNSSIQLFGSIGPSNNLTELVTIHLNDKMDKDTDYILIIKYSGNIRDDLTGFYQSTYMEKGVKKHLAVTHFEPTSARKAFPCFDEPSFKATFNLKIGRLNGQGSLSNTRKVNEVNNTDFYEETPEMSTYLLAFMVFEFEEPAWQDNTIRVWSRPEVQNYTQYAIEIGTKLLKHYDNYTGYSYYDKMIPKMDFAAIPQFSSLAMENWGLITFAQSSILYDIKKNDTRYKQFVALNVAHELSHQWLGNLVTCDWWKYLWLNEGFARYQEYFATAKIEPTWNMDHQFVVDVLQNILFMDSSPDREPLNFDVNTAFEIMNRFNGITYEKGASIIRMLELWMGKEEFHSGIQRYLSQRAFQTAQPNHLYSSLNLNSSLIAMMESWTNQPGYPVVSVKVSKGRRSIKLSQRRFLRNIIGPVDKELIYHIPITYTTSKINGSKLMIDRTDNIDLGDSFSWILLNVEQAGYYRVNYDNKSWYQIMAALSKEDHDGIHLLNRAQIIDDALNLARGNVLDYETTFDILDYLETEKEYIPWRAAMNGLEYIGSKMTGPNNDLFGKYVRKMFENIYQHLGFYPKPTTDSHVDILNRANVIRWMCKYNHMDCMSRVKEEFHKAKVDGNYSIPEDIREAVYCAQVRNADSRNREYLWFWKRYQNESMATEKQLLMNAMGCVEDLNVLMQHLSNILSAAVQKQDRKSAVLSFLPWLDSQYLQKILEEVKRKDSQLYEMIKATVPAPGSDKNWEKVHLSNLQAILDKKTGTKGAAADSITISLVLLYIGVILSWVTSL